MKTKQATKMKAPLKASTKPSPVRKVKVTLWSGMQNWSAGGSKAIEKKVLAAKPNGVHVEPKGRRSKAHGVALRPIKGSSLVLVKPGKSKAELEAAKKSAKKKEAPKAPASNGEFRGKRSTLHDLLTRKGGATYGEIKKRCEWPGGCKGEMNSMARKLGRKLKPGKGEGDQQVYSL